MAHSGTKLALAQTALRTASPSTQSATRCGDARYAQLERPKLGNFRVINWSKARGWSEMAPEQRSRGVSGKNLIGTPLALPFCVRMGHEAACPKSRGPRWPIAPSELWRSRSESEQGPNARGRDQPAGRTRRRTGSSEPTRTRCSPWPCSQGV
jgi:hypothetical protein